MDTSDHSLSLLCSGCICNCISIRSIIVPEICCGSYLTLSSASFNAIALLSTLNTCVFFIFLQSSSSISVQTAHPFLIKIAANVDAAGENPSYLVGINLVLFAREPVFVVVLVWFGLFSSLIGISQTHLHTNKSDCS